MSGPRARAFAVCLLCTGTAVLFFLSAVLALPLPLYYPLARRWTLGPMGLGPGNGDNLPGPSMDYYGRSVFAWLGGAVLALAAYALLRRLRRPVPAALPQPQPTLALFTAYALTALLLCASLYAYKLWTRDVTPEALPSWYQPR